MRFFVLMIRRPPRSTRTDTLFPDTTLFRSYSLPDYAVLQAHGPQQWPYNAATQSPQRLYTNGVFPSASGRANFMDVGYVPVAEQTSAAYPLRLTTGRMRDQWHTLSRSGLAPALNSHVEETFVYLPPGDMQRRKI